MAKVKYIPCDIYKRGITVFLGSLDELKRWVKSEYVADEEKDFAAFIQSLKKEKIGGASFNYNNNDGQGIVLFHKFPETPKEIACVDHELLHATFHLLDFCNVDFICGGSNEAYTYLHEHLMRNALEKEGYIDL